MLFSGESAWRSATSCNCVFKMLHLATKCSMTRNLRYNVIFVFGFCHTSNSQQYTEHFPQFQIAKL